MSQTRVPDPGSAARQVIPPPLLQAQSLVAVHLRWQSPPTHAIPGSQGLQIKEPVPAITAFQLPSQCSPSRAGVTHRPALPFCTESFSAQTVCASTSDCVPRRWQKVPSKQRNVVELGSHPRSLTAVWHVPESDPTLPGTHARFAAQMLPVHGSSEHDAPAPTYVTQRFKHTRC